MMDDQQLSEHFGFFELTQTSHAELQDQNRSEGLLILPKLKDLAAFAETVRATLRLPLVIHSGFRCHTLNSLLGSTDRSQHLLGEAIDFVPINMTLGDSFEAIKAAGKAGDLKFGQAIIESASRDYGISQWIHISRGVPVRDAGRCGQVLTMSNGIYNLLDTIQGAV